MVYKATLHDAASVYFVNLTSQLRHPSLHFQPVSNHVQVPGCAGLCTHPTICLDVVSKGKRQG